MNKNVLSILLFPNKHIENAEKTIDSIINQTNFNNIHVMLMDSQTNTEMSAILTNFSSQYNNIEITSMNMKDILADITSEYIMFLEEGYTLSNDTAEKLLLYSKEANSDVIIGGTDFYPDDVMSQVNYRYFGQGNILGDNILDFPGFIFNCFTADKILKTSHLKKICPNLTIKNNALNSKDFIEILLHVKNVAILDYTTTLVLMDEEGLPLVERNTEYKPEEKSSYLEKLNNIESLLGYSKTLPHISDRETVQYYIVLFYQQYFIGLIENSTLFNETEKNEIFNRSQHVFMQIPTELIFSSIKNDRIKVMLIALLENDSNAFFQGLFEVDQLRIYNNRLYMDIPRTQIPREYLKVVRTAPNIDSIEIDGEDLVIYGFMNTPNFVFTQNFKNNISFYLETKNKQYTFPVTLFKRPDFTRYRDTGVQGLKCRIPLKVINKIKVNCQLNFQIQDPITKNHLKIKPLATGILHRFKGINKLNNRPAYFMDIYNKRSIYFRTGNLPLKSKLGIQLKKIININKKQKLRRGWKMRAMYLCLHPFYKNKLITLIGERRDTFQDNSSHLFKYIRETYPKDKTYYIITKDSVQYDEVKQYGNVLVADSFKHKLFLLFAKTMINSYDIESYMIPSSYSKMEYLKTFGDLLRYKRVFLQHGITYNDVVTAASKYKTAHDLIVTSNNKESDYFINRAFFKPNNIIKSSFPRYDRLAQHIRGEEIHTEKGKNILLMPTWRRNLANQSYNKYHTILVDDQTILQSDYYNFYNGILNDARIHQFLERTNTVLNFYPHYEMRSFLHLFNTTSDRVNIIKDEQAKVQDLLIENDLMITDYSSVFFDFAFMHKPIIFTQFDYEDFFKVQYREGIMSFKEQKFGPIVTTIDGLADELIKVEDAKFKMSDEANEYSRNFFEYYDGTNICEKVYRTIKSLK